jgi:hypothetical protein
MCNGPEGDAVTERIPAWFGLDAVPPWPASTTLW